LVCQGLWSVSSAQRRAQFLFPLAHDLFAQLVGVSVGQGVVVGMEGQALFARPAWL
jgi:hypothetical protein